MRTIKFRVWDTESKRFYNSFTKPDVKFTPVVNLGIWMPPSDSEEADRYVITQFTGLLDKQGKEIYEGDIIKCVEFPASGSYEVFFDNGSFKHKDTDGNINFHPKETIYTIIGNIYESPNLLSESEKGV